MLIAAAALSLLRISPGCAPGELRHQAWCVPVRALVLQDSRPASNKQEEDAAAAQQDAASQGNARSTSAKSRRCVPLLPG